MTTNGPPPRPPGAEGVRHGGKRVNVILAFHAQEPLWDLPARVVDTIRDEDIRREVIANDNWVRKRAEAGRDIYRDLLDLGERLGATVCLEATNEVLMQVQRLMPRTFERLGEAYRARRIYPIYGNAFHTHIAMLTDDELADELRLNREFLRDVLRAPEPRHPGAFPMEGSIDARKLGGFRRAGMEYVIFPNISPKKMRYAFEGLPEGADAAHGAFTIGQGLLALPRHFPVSQEIWRPITKWQPQRLIPQGYILGKFAVLDEEYRTGRSVDFPIERPQAVAEYTQTLRDAVAEAPDGGLLLYIQDLELMDFGEEALDILGEAWERVRREGIADVRFVTPDEYVDELRLAEPHPPAPSPRAERKSTGPGASAAASRAERGSRALPRLRFHEASWAPEIRLCLRSDGHYPPLHAGPVRGIDNDEEVFRRWPFIFWEPGRFITDTFRTLLGFFGQPLEIPMDAEALAGRGYDFDDDLTDAEKLTVHLRAMQRACNWGWQPDEDRHKWPYMHGLAICEILRRQMKDDEVRERVAGGFAPLPDRALHGLDRVLEIIVDTRVAYLRRGIENLGERAGPEEKRRASEQHLRGAERRRQRASALARTLRAENNKLLTGCAIDQRAIERVLALLQEHCKEAYLAITSIQRAWMEIEDIEGMIVQMYEYLYDVYPPRFPQILREMLSAEEIAMVDDPPLV